MFNKMSQQYFLEVRYINYAWGFQHNGIFIDLETGEVYSYNFKNKDSASWNAEGRLRNSHFAGKLSTEVMEQIDHFMSCLANGEPPEELEFKETGYASDAGGTSYSLVV